MAAESAVVNIVRYVYSKMFESRQTQRGGECSAVTSWLVEGKWKLLFETSTDHTKSCQSWPRDGARLYGTKEEGSTARNPARNHWSLPCNICYVHEWNP